MDRKKYLRIPYLSMALIILIAPCTPLQAESSVKAWVESLVIPTYRIGPPERNPIFYTGRAYQGAKGAVYPYPLLDRLTDVREMKTYKAAYLENDYIKICILPEIGGRIFRALDKTNDYDFFYYQHVIKPALIGMLGAWISGGVEWNFPHHHRATGFMDVDYTLTDNPDGSKTIWVGEIEIRHGMKWVIGLTLYPDRSFLEANIKIFNRTPFAHSFLCWANVAVHTNENYQIIFPPSTGYATFHGKNQFSQWPISHEVFNRVDYTKGVDVSRWKNHPASTSFFAWNCEDDFLAGYDHGKGAGVVHVADHHVVPGKKFWTWGTGSRGQMWEKILTDADGPYIELMVGAYSDNQPDYSWLQPYEARSFKQYWYPLRKIGGVKAANLEAACNLELISEDTVEIGFNTTSAHKSAKVVLEGKGKVIFEQEIAISPEKPWSKEIEFPSGVKQGDLKIMLFRAEGKELVSYSPSKKEAAPMPEPVKPPPPPEEIKTIEELYLTGLRLEQFHNPAYEPYPYYEEALRRDPGDYRVNTALGILYLKRGLFIEAEEKLNQALKRVTKDYTSPKDGEAFYYLGAALRAQGKHEAASDAFYKAAWSAAWSSAGYHSLAELACQKGKFLKSLEFLDRALIVNSLNTKTLNLKAAILRRLGRFKEAENCAFKAATFDPLDFWAENELCLVREELGFKEEAMQKWEALKVKMRDDVQSYLELAVDYGNCGLWDEAIEVLSSLVRSKKKAPSRYPMIYYYLGYFLEKTGEMQKSHEYYKLACEMPPDYCFPHRLESIQVLRQAQGQNPADSRAPYYLGNLLFDIQPEEAIKEWEKSRRLDDTFSIVHRNLGLAYARVENTLHKAISSLEKAVACEPKDPRLYYELDLYYEARGISPLKRLELLEQNHSTVLKRDDTLSCEISLLVQLGKYDRAIELLETHHFHVWEGGGRIHNIYVDAHLMRGEEYFRKRRYQDALKDYETALEYPENLEVGRPYRGGRSSQVYYFIGKAHEALGNVRKAREFYEKSVALRGGWSEISYYQGLAFRKLGQEDGAERMFEGLIESSKERIRVTPSMDFFAKFGERQSAMIRKANAHYLLGLGYLGKGKRAEAEVEFKRALELNVNHIGARKQLSNVGA